MAAAYSPETGDVPLRRLQGRVGLRRLRQPAPQRRPRHRPDARTLSTARSPRCARSFTTASGCSRRRERRTSRRWRRPGDPDAPPSLVIVIDEFAALVNEVPDFVDGVVDIAQRGRSLGLHLIMATQRPAGVIKDNLRANTNLRIALRMADEADSSDILGVAAAAHVDPRRLAARWRGPARVGSRPSSRHTREPTACPGSTGRAPDRRCRDWLSDPGGRGRLPERRAASRQRVNPTRRASCPRSRVRPRCSGSAASRRPWLDELASTVRPARYRSRTGRHRAPRSASSTIRRTRPNSWHIRSRPGRQPGDSRADPARGSRPRCARIALGATLVTRTRARARLRHRRGERRPGHARRPAERRRRR